MVAGAPAEKALDGERVLLDARLEVMEVEGVSMASPLVSDMGHYTLEFSMRVGGFQVRIWVLRRGLLGCNGVACPQLREATNPTTASNLLEGSKEAEEAGTGHCRVCSSCDTYHRSGHRLAYVAWDILRTVLWSLLVEDSKHTVTSLQGFTKVRSRAYLALGSKQGEGLGRRLSKSQPYSFHTVKYSLMESVVKLLMSLVFKFGKILEDCGSMGVSQAKGRIRRLPLWSERHRMAVEASLMRILKFLHLCVNSSHFLANVILKVFMTTPEFISEPADPMIQNKTILTELSHILISCIRVAKNDTYAVASPFVVSNSLMDLSGSLLLHCLPWIPAITPVDVLEVTKWFGKTVKAELDNTTSNSDRYGSPPSTKPFPVLSSEGDESFFPEAGPSAGDVVEPLSAHTVSFNVPDASAERGLSEAYPSVDVTHVPLTTRPPPVPLLQSTPALYSDDVVMAIPSESPPYRNPLFSFPFAMGTTSTHPPASCLSSTPQDTPQAPPSSSTTGYAYPIEPLPLLTSMPPSPYTSREAPPDPPHFKPSVEAFARLPYSDVFICGEHSDNFAAEANGSILRVNRCHEIGGIALCRIPLTFPSLRVPQWQPMNILTFRILRAGRFGITITPAHCVIAPPIELFERNDVVGFRTPRCPPFWNVATHRESDPPTSLFAATVLYHCGDILDVRFDTEEALSGSGCLRAELMVSGESIGSVLEVYFELAAQQYEDKRMNLVFLFQDEVCLKYEGPPFVLECRVEDTALASTTQEAKETLLSNPLKDTLFEALKYEAFREAILQYRTLFFSEVVLLQSLKEEVVRIFCNQIRLAGRCLHQLHERHTPTDSFMGEWRTEDGAPYGRHEGSKSSNAASTNTMALDEKLIPCFRMLSVLITLFGDRHEDEEWKLYLQSIDLVNCMSQDRPKNIFVDFPWCLSRSNIASTALYGLTSLQCQELIGSVSEFLSTPSIQSKINTFGRYDMAQYLEQKPLLNALTLLLGSRCLLGCCLLTRTLQQLHTIEETPIKAGTVSAFESIVDVMESFCLFSAGSELDATPKKGSLNPQGESVAVESLYASNPLPGVSMVAANASTYTPRSANSISPNGVAMDGSPLPSPTASMEESNILKEKGYRLRGYDKEDLAAEGGHASAHKRRKEYKSFGIKEIATSCGFPEEVMVEDVLRCPSITYKGILPVEETSHLWNWLFEKTHRWNALGWDYCRPPQMLEGRLSSKNDSLTFASYMGSMNGPKFFSRLKLSLVNWCMQNDVVDTLCAIAGFLPDIFVSRLHKGVEAIEESVDKPKQRCFTLLDSSNRVLSKATNVLRLCRVCAYYCCRKKVVTEPDYWLFYNQHIDRFPTSEHMHTSLEKVSMDEPLYGWQKVFYKAVLECPSEAMQARLLELLQVEVIYHLVGSVWQIFSLRKATQVVNQKLCALSPSIHVVHWLIDSFIRHPFCPLIVRRAILMPLVWSAIICLLINGTNLHIFIGLDVARVCSWMTAREVFLEEGGHCSRFSESGSDGRVVYRRPRLTREKLEQWQGIFDCIACCGMNLLHFYQKSYPRKMERLDCFQIRDQNTYEPNSIFFRSLNCMCLVIAAAIMKENDLSNVLQWPERLLQSSFRRFVDLMSISKRAGRLSMEKQSTMDSFFQRPATPMSRRDVPLAVEATEAVPLESDIVKAFVKALLTERVFYDESNTVYNSDILSAIASVPVEVHTSACIPTHASVGYIRSHPNAYIQLSLKRLYQYPTKGAVDGVLMEDRPPTLLVAADRHFNHILYEKWDFECYHRPPHPTTPHTFVLGGLSYQWVENQTFSFESEALLRPVLCLWSSYACSVGSSRACITLNVQVHPKRQSLYATASPLTRILVGCVNTFPLERLSEGGTDRAIECILFDIVNLQFVSKTSDGRFEADTPQKTTNWIWSALERAPLEVQCRFFKTHILWILNGIPIASCRLRPDFRKVPIDAGGS